jgi:hypothetical protein
MESACIQKIRDLFSHYDGDEFVEKKIYEFVVEMLPVKVDALIIEKFKREVRREHLDDLSNKFIQAFLSNNEHQYFYIPNTDKYVEYDGVTYTHINADSILFKVLKAIKQHPSKELLQWKYKIKTHIIKQIKERNMLKNIPESATIQAVIGMLMATICADKAHAKYFLSVVGDNVLNKHKPGGKLNYFIDEKFKVFMSVISDFAVSSFKYAFNPVDNFKYRFNISHHKLEDARVIHLENHGCLTAWKSLMKEHFLDFINVAAHYSVRYGSADKYAEEADASLHDHVFYLRENKTDDIVSKFIDANLVFVDKSSPDTLDAKQIYYLWKAYLREKKLPIILSSGVLMADMPENVGIKSKKESYMPKFVNFWNTMVIADDGEKYLEIGELFELFLRWLRENGDAYEKFATTSLNEEAIADLIKDYANVEIMDNKYIDGRRCLIWDKRADVGRFLDGKMVDNEETKVVYKKYCEWCKTNNAKIVSINYFRWVAE